MFDYLEKFNKLPKEFRSKVSSTGVMSAIKELEKKYGVNLAVVVMKVMTKDIAVNSLDIYFVDEFKLDSVRAVELSEELKERVFFDVGEYLGIRQSSEIKSERMRDFKKLDGKENQKILPKVVIGESNRVLAQQSARQKIESGVDIKSKFDANSVFESRASIQLKTGASFFFSPEDEEEIRELTKKIDGKFDNVSYNGEIGERLGEIIKQAQINFGSEQLLIRFKQIIETYLRGIRDKIETKQALIKSFNEGGLNFDNESANKILLIARDKNLGKVAIKPLKKIGLPEKAEEVNRVGLKNIVIRDVDYDLDSLRKKQAEKNSDYKEGEINKKDKIKKLDIEHELAPPPPKLSGVDNISVSTENKYKKVALADKDIELRKKIVKKDNKTKKATSPILNIRRSFEPSGKKKMEDVKFVPKIMNPIDELRYMDLINFRRLDSNPAERMQKIEKKVNLLEEEAYSKRMEGIQAWRKSPVNILYLKMGQQSIGEKKSIEAIIEDKKISRQDYLSAEEFNAIMDMNKNLRF